MINATALQLKNYGMPMHLGGLLSTQTPRVDLGHSYASFMLSNLPCTSITQWLCAEHLIHSLIIFMAIRKKNYNSFVLITGMFCIKGVVKHIIPAVASTNAVIAGNIMSFVLSSL